MSLCARDVVLFHVHVVVLRLCVLVCFRAALLLGHCTAPPSLCPSLLPPLAGHPVPTCASCPSCLSCSLTPRGLLSVHSATQRRILLDQEVLWGQHGLFAKVCDLVKRFPGGKKGESAYAREELRRLAPQLPRSSVLPFDPRVRLGDLDIEECKVLTLHQRTLRPDGTVYLTMCSLCLGEGGGGAHLCHMLCRVSSITLSCLGREWEAW